MGRSLGVRSDRPRAKRPQKGDQSTSLLVRNLSYHTRVDDIKEQFGEYGGIRDVYIPVDLYTKQPRGFAFVEFHDARDAEFAKHQMNRREMHGREITVLF